MSAASEVIEAWLDEMVVKDPVLTAEQARVLQATIGRKLVDRGAPSVQRQAS